MLPDYINNITFVIKKGNSIVVPFKLKKNLFLRISYRVNVKNQLLYFFGPVSDLLYAP